MYAMTCAFPRETIPPPQAGTRRPKPSNWSVDPTGTVRLTVLDGVKQWAARAAYRLSALGRRFRSRAPLGAAVAVVWRDRLLVVRHSYRPGAGLPGGSVKRGEAPVEGARRELAEEVGIRVPATALKPVYADLWLRIFEYRPEREPEVTVDRFEVVEARFVEFDAIDEPSTALRAYLLCRIP